MIFSFLLFLKERHFRKERIALLRSVRKERKSESLLGALFEKSGRAICSFVLFLKERKSESLFCALLEKSERANRSFSLFLKRAKERKSNCPTLENTGKFHLVLLTNSTGHLHTFPQKNTGKFLMLLTKLAGHRIKLKVVVI